MEVGDSKAGIGLQIVKICALLIQKEGPKRGGFKRCVNLYA